LFGSKFVFHIIEVFTFKSFLLEAFHAQSIDPHVASLNNTKAISSFF
jgi:hypothetical protein